MEIQLGVDPGFSQADKQIINERQAISIIEHGIIDGLLIIPANPDRPTRLGHHDNWRCPFGMPYPVKYSFVLEFNQFGPNFELLGQRKHSSLPVDRTGTLLHVHKGWWDVRVIVDMA